MSYPKGEVLADLAREQELYAANGGELATLTSVLYSAVKLLTQGNRYEADGGRLLAATDAGWAKIREARDAKG